MARPAALFRLSRFFCLAIAVASLVGVARDATANGWEHGAVPFEALVEALRYDDSDIRREAATSLGFREQPEGVGPLIGRLTTPEPVPGVRRAIYVALGRIGARRGLEALEACLEEEADPVIRADCVIAMGKIGTRRAFVTVLALAENGDESLVTRAAAVSTLGDFAEPDSVVALTRIAESVPALRSRAILALGETGLNAASAPLLDILGGAPEDAELVVRALARLASPDATDTLLALLDGTDDPTLRANITVALGAARDQGALASLIEMLADPTPAVRYLAIEGIEGLGDPSAAPALAALADREAKLVDGLSPSEMPGRVAELVASASLRARALRAATELDATGAVEALLAAGAAKALPPRDSAEALEVIAAIYQRRRAALHGLAYVGAGWRNEAETLLAGKSGLGDPDPRLRAVATRSLGVLRGAASADAVRRMLEDPAPEVRETAARVLGLVGDRASLARLVEALSDPRAPVRREAALALGYIGDTAAREALRKAAAEDRSTAVRDAAGYALAILP